MSRRTPVRGYAAGLALAAWLGASAERVAHAEEPPVEPPATSSPAEPSSLPTEAPAPGANGATTSPEAFDYGEPPPAPTGREATTRRRSTPLMVSGIVLTGIGAVSALYGIAALLDDGNPCLPLQSDAECQDQSPRTVGVVLTITAGALVATGVPFILVGGTRVPRDPPPGVSAELLVAPNGGAVRLRF